MTDLHQIHAIINGKVQGVSFRYHTVQAALKIGCTGWVRNTPMGTVECLAQGTEHQLETLIAFLHVGSPAAHVESVEVEWQQPETTFDVFSIAYY